MTDSAVDRPLVEAEPVEPARSVARRSMRERLLALRDDGPSRRALIAIAAVCLAFHHSLWRLITSLGVDNPLAYLGLVPFVSLGLILVLSRPRPGELEVHDRYLDGIVAIPLMVVPLLVLAVVPGTMGTLFWLWRIDLLVFPLFVSGVIAMMFGTRLLLRAKAGVLFLFLAWPAPFQYLLQRWLDAFTSLTVSVVHSISSALHLATPANGIDGGFIISTPSGGRFTVMVASQCSGANSLLGYLLIAGALLVVLKGTRRRKAAWLVAGAAIVWVANVLRICLIFVAGQLWGERVAIDGFHPYIGLVSFAVATGAAVWLLPRFGIGFGSATPDPERTRRSVIEAVPKMGAALMVVAVLVAPTAVLDARLAKVDPVASALGLPRLPPFDPASLQPDGFQGTRVATYTWARRYFGDDSDWTRYELTGGDESLSTDVPIYADVVTTSDLSTFDAFGIDACYAFHGYDVSERHSVDLGTGVDATMLVWKDPEMGGRWSTLYWYWPVLEDGQTRYQRIVLLMSTDSAGSVAAPSTSHDDRQLNDDSSGENLGPSAAAQERDATRQRLLAGIGRLLVRESVKGASGAD